MKKLNRYFALSALAISAFTLPAFAADGESMRVSVPFAFVVGTKTLPAGQYYVSETAEHIVTIGGKQGGAMMMERAGASTKANTLIFKRKGNDLVLSSVHLTSEITDGTPVPVQ